MKTDKETKKILSEAEKIKATIETPGWEIITSRFAEYLNALDSVQNIKETDPSKVAELILVNQKVYKTLEMFWGDIIGEANTSVENSEVMDEDNPIQHILYQE